MTTEGDETVWENLNPYRMTQEEADEVIRDADGATVCWTRGDGRAIGVWVSHAVLDGDLYVTTTGNRAKTREWKQDPHISVVVHARGKGSVTVMGTVDLSDDRALVTRFLESLADRGGMPPERREFWMKRMNSGGRLVGKVTPEKYITFDERKLT